MLLGAASVPEAQFVRNRLREFPANYSHFLLRNHAIMMTTITMQTRISTG